MLANRVGVARVLRQKRPDKLFAGTELAPVRVCHLVNAAVICIWETGAKNKGV